MQIIFERPDGIHLLAEATLQQLSENEMIRQFANGLILQSLSQPELADKASWPLAQALHQPDSVGIKALLVVLLVLDAELHTLIDKTNRILRLPGFLSYRSRLPLNKVPLNTLRLPPLNPDGRYLLKTVDKDHYLAMRMDIHPKSGVVGHVRVAIGSRARPPQRIRAIEDRLDRQILNNQLIGEVTGATAMALTEQEKRELLFGLRELSNQAKLHC